MVLSVWSISKGDRDTWPFIEHVGNSRKIVSEVVGELADVVVGTGEIVVGLAGFGGSGGCMQTGSGGVGARGFRVSGGADGIFVDPGDPCEGQCGGC